MCGELAHIENQQFSSNMFPFLFLFDCPSCLLNIVRSRNLSLRRRKDNEWNEECIFIVELKLVGISIGSWKQQHNSYIYTFYVLCSCCSCCCSYFFPFVRSSFSFLLCELRWMDVSQTVKNLSGFNIDSTQSLVDLIVFIVFSSSSHHSFHIESDGLIVIVQFGSTFYTYSFTVLLYYDRGAYLLVSQLACYSKSIF